jgi:hypothetical protein
MEMRRLCRRSPILTFGVLLLGSWAPIRAGVITPDSIPSPPPAVSPIAQGTVVLPSQQASDQYAGLGLVFGNAAVGEIHGVKVWLPTLNFFNPEQPSSGSNSLNFVAPATIVGGTNVPGNADAAAKTDVIRAEFIFDSDATTAPRMVAADAHFHLLTTNMEFVGIGPHGGMLEQLQATGMSIFGLSGYTPALTDHWGIAEIETGPLTALQPAPEPGSLVLASLGSLTVLGYVRRRRG